MDKRRRWNPIAAAFACARMICGSYIVERRILSNSGLQLADTINILAL